MKSIIVNKEAKEKLKLGAEKVAEIVKLTLGPKGRNVVLDRKYSTPLITNDGATIAREIDLEDQFENMGCKLIKEVCAKTNDDAGDGTTTAIVLANKMLNLGLKYGDNGINPTILNEGIKMASELAIKYLKSKAKPVKTSKDIENIATISSGSTFVGSLIKEAYEFNNNCNITLMDSKTSTTTLTKQDGMAINSGLLSTYFATSIEKGICEYDNPYILITDKKINNFSEILGVFEQIMGQNRPIIIICDDIDSEALSTIIVNVIRKTFRACVIKAPLYGDKKKAILEDIASLCDCEVISDENGLNLKNALLENLGEIKHVKVTNNQTIIISNKKNNERLKKRLKLIETEIENCTSDYDKEMLKNRLANLSGGIASILVGANSDIEQKEFKLRIEDAICATNSALELGVLPGGGSSLYKSSKVLRKYKSKLKNKDLQAGFDIVIQTLETPIRQILDNAGLNSDKILNKINDKKSINFGFDAQNNVFCNLEKKGIIDPAKVPICALQNASSIVRTMLTTEALVCDEQK